jgi:hypothetical protein
MPAGTRAQLQLTERFFLLYTTFYLQSSHNNPQTLPSMALLALLILFLLLLSSYHSIENPYICILRPRMQV